MGASIETVASEAPNPGPTRAALDALWSRHRSGWRRLFSPRLVRELTLRARFDPDLIVPAKIKNRVEPATIPDCARCSNVCCAGLENTVSLRLRDIAMLMDLGRTDLISKKKPNFPAWMLRERPHLAELVASELFRTLPVLRQEPQTRVCAALSKDVRCTLYPHWPISCERFPYSLSTVRREVFWGRRCPEKRRGPEHARRSHALFAASIAAYNERVRDAVLLAHARRELESLGIGAFLTSTGEDPFEPRPRSLEVIG